VIALLCIAAFAQQKPSWSNSFSASELVKGRGERHQDRSFFRWFYDLSSGMERFDGPARYKGEFYFTTSLFSVKTQMETFIIYQDDMVECFTNKTSGFSLPHPNFNRAVYVGKALVDYQLCNHWVETHPDGTVANDIFSLESNGEVKRIDHHDRRRPRSVSFTFIEFDSGTQDPTLWIIPAAIKYQKDILALGNHGPTARLKQLTDLVNNSVKAGDELGVLAKQLSSTEDAKAAAQHSLKKVIPKAAELRSYLDDLELLVDKLYWPLPTYEEILHEKAS